MRQDYLGAGALRLELTVNLGGASHLAMIRHAAGVIAAGEADSVLCLGAGKFPASRDVGARLMAMTSHPDYELPTVPRCRRSTG